METKLYVLVKGNKHAASLAASRRGIPFAFYMEFEFGRDTAGFVPMSYFDKVSEWFAADNVAPPFPSGSCLHFHSI